MKKPAGRSAEQARLFKASGAVELTGKLDALLYLLMRDHVTPGVIGGLLQDLNGGPFNFTNGWLARYANYVARELNERREIASRGSSAKANSNLIVIRRG